MQIIDISSTTATDNTTAIIINATNTIATISSKEGGVELGKESKSGTEKSVNSGRSELRSKSGWKP